MSTFPNGEVKLDGACFHGKVSATQSVSVFLSLTFSCHYPHVGKGVKLKLMKVIPEMPCHILESRNGQFQKSTWWLSGRKHTRVPTEELRKLQPARPTIEMVKLHTLNIYFSSFLSIPCPMRHLYYGALGKEVLL